jgi:hypothetical protein
MKEVFEAFCSIFVRENGSWRKEPIVANKICTHPDIYIDDEQEIDYDSESVKQRSCAG